MAETAIAAAQPGQDLVESAVRDHARLVYRIAYSVLRNPAEAEDAVQDVFLRVLRYGNKAARIDDRKAWLARIAWRVAVERRHRLADSAALPDQLRDPLVLAMIEELPPRETAAMLGISEAAVRSRAFRARQILRDRMATWMGGSK